MLLFGGSGLIGTHLRHKLQQKGKKFIVVSRQSDNEDFLTWDELLERGSIPEGFSTIVQLCGANIFEHRWSDQRKQELRDSRIKTTQKIVDLINKSENKPKTVIIGSAIGYYPQDGGTYDESYEGPHDNSFPGNLVRDLERTALPLKEQGIRVVLLRTGVVLTKDGGALQNMKVAPYLWSGVIGDGSHAFPWIHIDDLVDLIQEISDNDSYRGIVNGVSPQMTSQREFVGSIRRNCKGFVLPPAPKMALNIAFGERSMMLTKGSFVIPQKALNNGFEFNFPDLDLALSNIESK